MEIARLNQAPCRSTGQIPALLCQQAQTFAFGLWTALQLSVGHQCSALLPSRSIIPVLFRRRHGKKLALPPLAGGLFFGPMIPLLIAGGSLITTLVAPQLPDSMNHTLSGSPVKAAEVVCRTRWGTPMMPDGKGSYNLITAPDPILIERSLIQPPKTSAPFYHPGKPYILPSQAMPAQQAPAR
jgi:hypothetical protein